MSKLNKIIIKESNIVKEDVDVIVNAANEALSGGGGVDGAIHQAAGSSVMDECQKIGRCPAGTAVITSAGGLRAKKIIHTAGPIWLGGENKEEEKLKNCYQASFRLAIKHHLKTIAFPAISTGVYKFPMEKATKIAIQEALQFEGSFDEIRFVCFSKEAHNVYRATLDRLQT